MNECSNQKYSNGQCQPSRLSVLTDVEDGQLGHHWNFIYVSVAPGEGPHLGVLGLEAGLP